MKTYPILIKKRKLWYPTGAYITHYSKRSATKLAASKYKGCWTKLGKPVTFEELETLGKPLKQK